MRTGTEGTDDVARPARWGRGRCRWECRCSLVFLSLIEQRIATCNAFTNVRVSGGCVPCFSGSGRNGGSNAEGAQVRWCRKMQSGEGDRCASECVIEARECVMLRFDPCFHGCRAFTVSRAVNRTSDGCCHAMSFAREGCCCCCCCCWLTQVHAQGCQ